MECLASALQSILLQFREKFLLVTQDAETPMRLENKLSPALLKDTESRDALMGRFVTPLAFYNERR